jgi:hypothetical protein
VSTPVNKVEADLAAVKAWYKSKPLYAGAVIGAVLHSLAVHFLHFPI